MTESRGRASGSAEDGHPAESRPIGLGEKETKSLRSFLRGQPGWSFLTGCFNPATNDQSVLEMLPLSPLAAFVLKSANNQPVPRPPSPSPLSIVHYPLAIVPGLPSLLWCSNRQIINLSPSPNGTRVLSAYRTKSGDRIWIITEADRSAATVLLPEEY